MARMNSILLLLVWCCLITGTLAADHYIRAGASGNGSDWTNAYGELPATLVRGDTYYIADGNYPDYTVDDGKSGQTLITIKKATVSDHGTEAGWQEAYGDGQAVFPGLNINTSYMVWDGVRGGGADRSAYGFRMEGNCDRVVGLPAMGNHNNSFTAVTFSHTAVIACGQGTACQMCIYSNPLVALRFTVSHCYFTGGSSNMQTRKWQDCIIEYNYFDGNWSSSSCHGQQISPGGGEKNVTYRYNIFKNSSVFVLGIHGITGNPAGMYARNTVKVYGNLVIGGNFTAIFANADSGHDNVVVQSFFHNNTVINADCGGRGVVFVGNLTDPTGDKSYAYNNLIYNSTKVGFGVEHDHNSFYDCELNWNFSPATNEKELTGNPFVNVASENLQLTRATDRGKALSAPYDKDYNGSPRGADGTWDRGAYEYVKTNIERRTLNVEYRIPSTQPQNNIIRVYDLNGCTTNMNNSKQTGIYLAVDGTGVVKKVTVIK